MTDRSRPPYPFAALVGLEDLKTVLLLAAIDGRLGVLIRGDKGAGKSTAARALAALLPDDAPFVNLPVGTTDDRLLGGLDVERAMRGEPALKAGLLSRAHGGVLYIDEVNLLPDHLADALLDAAASGVHILEREGYSVEHDARFVLAGSMNPEEGTLRPQLQDRFALAVDVAAPSEPAARRLAVERRLAFDADPGAFVARWLPEQGGLRDLVRTARQRLVGISCSGEVIEIASTLVCERGVQSLRADLAAVVAGRALAALHGSASVSVEHVRAVLPFVLAHRGRQSHIPPPAPPRATPQPPQDRAHGPSEPTEDETGAPLGERVFAPRPVAAPRVVVNGEDGMSPGGGRSARGQDHGPAIRARASETPRELDVRASITHALARTGTPLPQREDLHEKVRLPIAGTRFLFVVDASGSHAARDRMRLVKGAVLGLLDASARRHDEVAVVAFRGSAASVILEPTSRQDEAERALAYLPTGGRTPLAHGLVLASRYVNGRTVLVLLTDGRANVPQSSHDAWADALTAAAAIRCPALVIDSDVGPQSIGRSRALADAMHARYLALEGLDGGEVVRLASQLV